MTAATAIKTTKQAYELANTVANEILAEFQKQTPHYYQSGNGEKPIKFVVQAPSLKGHSRQSLDGLTHNFNHAVSYGSNPALRKGCGVIATLVTENDTYTGEVR